MAAEHPQNFDARFNHAFPHWTFWIPDVLCAAAVQASVSWVYGVVIGFFALAASLVAIVVFIGLATFVPNARRASVLAGAVLMLVALSLATGHYELDDDVIYERIRDEVGERVRYDRRQFDLAGDLFRALPADSHFLIRGRRIDKKAASQVVIHGPEEDDVMVMTFSRIRSTDKGEPYAVLLVDSSSATKRNVLRGMYTSLPLREGESVVFSDASEYEYTVFVEEDTLQEVVLAVSRRNMIRPPRNLRRSAIANSELRILGTDLERPRAVLVGYGN